MDNKASYVDLFKQGNFLLLSMKRIRNIAMEIFKCFYSMYPVYLTNLFCKQEIRYNLRYKTVEQPTFCTKTYGNRSFRYYGSKIMEFPTVRNKEYR